MKLKRSDGVVQFDYPGDEGVKLSIRSLPQSVLIEIRNKIHESIPHVQVDLKTELLDRVDSGLMTWEMFDYALVDWQGIEVEGVTEKAEVKKAIFNYLPLCKFVFDKANELTEALSGKLEQEIKNSGSSRDG